MSHGRVQHRQRQRHPGEHAAGQVGELPGPFGLLGVPGRLGRRARHRRRLVLGLVRQPGLDDQRAADHVHSAREPELSRLTRIKPHDGPLVGGQRGARPEIREHDAGGAVAGFLPVEGQLDGHALAHPDHLGTVAALDRHLQPLDPVREHRGRGLARPEEEPAQPGERRNRRHGDENACRVDHEPNIPIGGINTLTGVAPCGDDRRVRFSWQPTRPPWPERSSRSRSGTAWLQRPAGARTAMLITSGQGQGNGQGLTRARPPGPATIVDNGSTSHDREEGLS